MDIKTGYQTKGTRILYGETAKVKKHLLDTCETYALNNGYQLMYLPAVQFQETFKDKIGPENKKMMFKWKDDADRELCLAPEYTAVIQKLATTQFFHEKDVKIYYMAECFRGEKPQAGRYRQFTQFGIEILNPTKDYFGELTRLAERMIFACAGIMRSNEDNTMNNFIINHEASRGLDYYKQGKGFEYGWASLGAQKQICGGGAYDNGIGFAIGIDRLMLI